MNEHNGHQDTCPCGTPIGGPVIAAGAPLKTFCEQCAREGNPGFLEGAYNLQTSSTIVYDPVKAAIEKWQDKLGLSNWQLYVAKDWKPTTDREDAYVYRMGSEREAIIAIHPKAPEHYVERLVVHELLHLAHASLDDVAENGRSVEVMELYAANLEVFINTMSTAMTDAPYLPIDPAWRERYELVEELPVRGES